MQEITQIKEVKSQQDFYLASELFKEYAKELGVDLSFQNFSKELQNLHKDYARPKGILLIAVNSTIRPLDV